MSSFNNNSNNIFIVNREQLSVKVNQIITKYLDDYTIYNSDSSLPERGINHFVYMNIIVDIESEFEIPIQEIYNTDEYNFYSLKLLSLITENIINYLCDVLRIK